MKEYLKPLRVLIAHLSFGALAAVAAGGVQPTRETLLMDSGWRFHVGDEWGIAQNLAKAGSGTGPAGASFSDASWRKVDLPHDWAIEMPFDSHTDSSHGFRAVGPGFEKNSIGWYRKTLELPASDSGRRLWLQFDGAFRDYTVFVNGWFVGHHASGYHGARFDITDVANCGGSNVVAVRVDASHTEGWFYEGAGIYRHVWLVKTSPLAISPDGIFVHSTFETAGTSGPATIHLETTLDNAFKSDRPVMVTWEVTAPDGTVVASTSANGTAPDSDSLLLAGSAEVATPLLWSPEDPSLYELTTTVTSEGQVVDRKVTAFGIRTFAFDPVLGFLLNGRPYVIKGSCNHQDHAGVGAAIPDALQVFRIRQLKEVGMNAYRTAHNPPTPELLDACDRLGMIVMDECRLVGSDRRNLQWLEELVKRDRNHASVAIWSLGNEEFSVQSTPSGAVVAATMQDLVKRLDPTRPVTCNAAVGNDFSGINSVIEVRGWSYHIGAENMDAYHQAHPEQPNVGSEQGSTTTTRGIYRKDPARGYESAYDDNAQPWSNTAKAWWGFFATRPWLSGGFVWTGFDYRGEPTPYAWPCINSHFGILDTCGFRKDISWYYTAWWTDAPVLHLMPHWNWAGHEGEPIDVRALSNCDDVELFLNGTSLGRQAMPRNSELKWSVPYSPGTLSAKGYNGGKLVAETAVETTADAAAVALAPDRATIAADGEDLSVVAVSIVDAKGRVVPTAGEKVSFALEGPGRIIGVGNGDPSCHEPDKYFSAPTIETQDIQGWHVGHIENAYAPTIPELAPEFDDSSWKAVNVTGDSGPLKSREHAVYRAAFDTTPEMLAADGLELWIGKTDGDTRVYLNGTRIGNGAGPNAPTITNLATALKPGRNVIAVVVAGWDEGCGISKGTRIRIVGKPPAVDWSRNAFNGLAQVIVQSSREPGTLKLIAHADGLESATLEIAARRVESRPAVP